MNKNQGNVKRLELLRFKAIGSQKSKFEPNTGAGLLVADAARALLPVYALRRDLQSVDRPRAVHRRSDAAQDVDLRLQLLLRHHAALVSLYADRTLSDHAADQPVARAGLAARVAERPRDLGRDAAAALREHAGPGARLHGQLRQHGALRRLRLERVRHVPLRLGLRRLPRTGLLPREIPARMELAAFSQPEMPPSRR